MYCKKEKRFFVFFSLSLSKLAFDRALFAIPAFTTLTRRLSSDSSRRARALLSSHFCRGVFSRVRGPDHRAFKNPKLKNLKSIFDSRER